MSLFLHWRSAGEMCPRITIENGRVKLRSRNRVAKFRCRRNFLMIEGDRLVTCSLGTWRGTIPKCVGSGCGNVLPIANGRSLLLFGDAMAQFECNPGYELLGSSALSCNGRRWNTTAPTCEAPKHTLYDCNFEQLGMCTWASESTGDLRWQLSLGPSIVQGMGKRPRFDHTYGNVSGHYVYMDSTVNAGWNDVARLYSPVLKPFVISPSCVTLWLYRSVRSTGEVNIYVKPESEDLDIQAPEVQITDEAWNGWHLVYISLQDIDEPFQVVLEAVWGDGYMSDIAVDDFLVTFGPRCFELETEYARQSLDDFTNATDFNNPVIVPITTRSPMAIITVGPPPTSTTLEQRTLSTTTTTAVTTAAKPGGSSTPRSNAVTPAPPDVLSPAKTSSQAARVTTASIVRAPSTPLTTKSPNSRKPTRPIDRVSITRPTVVTERPAQIITTVSLDLPVSDEVKS
ncbi:MAM domain, partial [Trinorchestia longiramus]